jgi:hypothetical protein
MNWSATGNLPIQTCDDTVQGKWRMAVGILAPDGMSTVMAFIWSCKGIIDARDDENDI